MNFSNFSKYYKSVITLAFPIILGNLAHILVATVDVFVASKHSVDTLAAISIANAVIMCMFIAGIGLLSGISPVISNYLGAKNSAKKYLLSSILYSQIMATIFFIITISLLPFIDKFGFEAKLLPAIKDYLWIVSFSYFGAYLHFALKEFLQAFEIINFPNMLSFLAVVLNLIFNFAFVFGFWFIPSMGAIGLAISTLLVRILIGIILLFYTLNIVNLKNNYIFDITYIKQLLKVSLPIAVALILEFLAFNIVTLILGKISGLYAASQSLIITITSLTFMVPLAISNVIGIKVGYANGAKNYLDIKNYSIAGTSVTTVFMCFCALILFVFPKEILSLLTTDETLLNITVPIIRIAAAYQVFDGLQVSFSGILKGLKQTFFVTVAVILGYWFCGIPLGIFLAIKLQMNILGFWYGLSVAIVSICTLMGVMLIYVFHKLKKETTALTQD